MFNKLTIRDVDIAGKRVLIRVDFNVPLDERGRIADFTKIKASLPTINYAIEHGAKVILMSHLGRPKGKIEGTLRLTPVAEALSSLLKREVKKLPDCIGSVVKQEVLSLRLGDVVILENLRFHPDEEKNDPNFARELALLGEVYVNDAFGSSHRAHASVYGIPKFIKTAVAGFLLEKEIKMLDNLLNSPQRPFLALIGGSKVSTKIPVIKNLLDKVDMIGIGGGMSYTFLEAIGVDIGASLIEKDTIDVAKEILLESMKYDVTFYLPKDHVIADFISPHAKIQISDGKFVPSGWRGVDIGPKTLESMKNLINKAKTIIWNGPMGVVEIEVFSQGTRELAEYIKNSDAEVVIGGGDTASFAYKYNLADKVEHISTGGGATLEYLAGKELPGITALPDKC